MIYACLSFNHIFTCVLLQSFNMQAILTLLRPSHAIDGDPTAQAEDHKSCLNGGTFPTVFGTSGYRNVKMWMEPRSSTSQIVMNIHDLFARLKMKDATLCYNNNNWPQTACDSRILRYHISICHFTHKKLKSCLLIVKTCENNQEAFLDQLETLPGRHALYIDFA